jgi:hypothetical protein
LNADKQSNLAQWVSQYPDQRHIIYNDKMIGLFAKSPPPNDESEDMSWAALANLLEKTSSEQTGEK